MKQNPFEIWENMTDEQKIIKWYIDLQKKRASPDFEKSLRETPYEVSKEMKGELENGFILESALEELNVKKELREGIKEKIVADKENFCKSMLKALQDKFLS